MKTIIASAVLGAFVMLAPVAVAQTVHDLHGEHLPTSERPAIDGSWQQMRLKVSRHRVDNTISLAPDGRLRLQFTNGKRGVNGHWSMQPGKLCLELPVRGTECFDYTHALAKGETVPVTSDRGWTGSVTMLTDPAGSPLAQAAPVVAAR